MEGILGTEAYAHANRNLYPFRASFIPTGVSSEDLDGKKSWGNYGMRIVLSQCLSLSLLLKFPINILSY